MNKITWEAVGVDMPSFDAALLSRWITEVSEAHNKLLGPLTYIFCNDEKILEVNLQFLQHDYYTDIITFDYSRRRMISGDMFISLDTVASNAEMLGCSYERELMRVVIHGVLHLCGINDKAPGEREIMEMHENKALAMLDALKSEGYAV